MVPRATLAVQRVCRGPLVRLARFLGVSRSTIRSMLVSRSAMRELGFRRDPNWRTRLGVSSTSHDCVRCGELVEAAADNCDRSRTLHTGHRQSQQSTLRATTKSPSIAKFKLYGPLFSLGKVGKKLGNFVLGKVRKLTAVRSQLRRDMQTAKVRQ